jgi:hypothetical protein
MDIKMLGGKALALAEALTQAVLGKAFSGKL